MKKLILLFLISGTLQQIGAAQTPFNMDSIDLKDIMFSNAQAGWACGSNGVILHTTDNQNWYLQNTPTEVVLEDIHFRNQYNGYACGDSGVVLKTDDGGQNWTLLPAFTNNHLYEISRYLNYVWIAGDTVFVVATENLEQFSPFFFLEDTLLAFFNDYLNTIIVGEHYDDTTFAVLYSLDNGNIWDFTAYPVFEKFTAYNAYKLIEEIPQWSLFENWAVGENGGAYFSKHPWHLDPYTTWWYGKATTPDTLRLNCVDADTAGHEVWAAGINGRIEVSYDEGVVFDYFPSPTDKNLNGMAFVGLDNGWIVGDSGTLLHFDGASWQQCQTVFIPESINNQMQPNSDFVLYPNPAHDYLNIKIPANSGEIKLDLYDLNGNLLYSEIFTNQPISQNIKISIKGYNSGIYIANLKSNFLNITKKVMIRN